MRWLCWARRWPRLRQGQHRTEGVAAGGEAGDAADIAPADGEDQRPGLAAGRRGDGLAALTIGSDTAYSAATAPGLLGCVVQLA